MIIDIIIILIFIYYSIIGFKDGFFFEILSLTFLVMAFFVSKYLLTTINNYIPIQKVLGETLSDYLIVPIFIINYLVAGFFLNIFKIVLFKNKSFISRIFGFVIGSLRALFISFILFGILYKLKLHIVANESKIILVIKTFITDHYNQELKSFIIWLIKISN